MTSMQFYRRLIFHWGVCLLIFRRSKSETAPGGGKAKILLGLSSDCWNVAKRPHGASRLARFGAGPFLFGDLTVDINQGDVVRNDEVKLCRIESSSIPDEVSG